MKENAWTFNKATQFRSHIFFNYSLWVWILGFVMLQYLTSTKKQYSIANKGDKAHKYNMVTLIEVIIYIHICESIGILQRKPEETTYHWMEISNKLNT